MNEFRSAARNWDIEVENVAARLVRNGTPPYAAIEEAKRIVSRRRAARRIEELAGKPK